MLFERVNFAGRHIAPLAGFWQDALAPMIRPACPPETGLVQAGPRRRGPTATVCVALAAMVFAVFGQTVSHDFINYDDIDYVSENPVVSKGLTFRGIAWAFGHHAANWHPLTWISHMLDCQLYDLHPAGHHLTSVALHAATSVILFLVLREMTGAFWRSAFVAAVFAIHPLRAESVAWIAERKDVLSGFFFVVTIAAYLRYVRKPGIGNYALTAICYLLGLMSKPMLVSEPFVLLLLDYWPLQRKEPWKKLIAEKIPLLCLSAAVCLITFFSQNATLHNIGSFSLSYRVENAVVSGVIYIRQMFWPEGLALLYPFARHGLPLAQVALAAIILIVLSAIAFAQRRRRPSLWIGWLWYLIMLLPVIGIIQVGEQAHADRYTYLPQIGLYLAITWLAAEWLTPAPAGFLMGTVIIALGVCAIKQTSYWKNSETIWLRTIACTADNEDARNNLAVAYLTAGRVDDAIRQSREALRIRDRFATGHFTYGVALLRKGRIDNAIAQFRASLQLDPSVADTHLNLAQCLRQKGLITAAIGEYEEALRLNPELVTARNDFGTALRATGHPEEAIRQFKLAVESDPNNEDIRVNLANALSQTGRDAEAISEYGMALQIRPDDLEVLNNLAWLLATSGDSSLRDGSRAVRLAGQANGLARGNNATILGTLASAYAESGRFSDAIQTAQKAVAVARARTETNLALRLESQLKLYQAGHPFHAR